MRSANIAEVFSSIQGEGIYVGERMLFIRFAKCNLRCKTCDTKRALLPRKTFHVQRGPSDDSFFRAPNPVTSARLLTIAEKFQEELHHRTVSITGGEPLVQAAFLEEFLPVARKLFPMIYLETNGTLAKELARVLKFVDIIAMDIKLRSVTGENVALATHEKFLRLARGKKVFVKIVVGPRVNLKELEGAAKMLWRVAPGISLVLQPVSVKNAPYPFKPGELLALEKACLRYVGDIRIIPQVHRILKLR